MPGVPEECAATEEKKHPQNIKKKEGKKKKIRPIWIALSMEFLRYSHNHLFMSDSSNVIKRFSISRASLSDRAGDAFYVTFLAS
jgi:hypothetical protein